MHALDMESGRRSVLALTPSRPHAQIDTAGVAYRYNERRRGALRFIGLAAVESARLRKRVIVITTTGEIRKPLGVQASREFKSLPLRPPFVGLVSRRDVRGTVVITAGVCSEACFGY